LLYSPIRFECSGVAYAKQSVASALITRFSATHETRSLSKPLSIERQLWWKMPIIVGHVRGDVIMKDREPEARFAIAARPD